MLCTNDCNEGHTYTRGCENVPGELMEKQREEYDCTMCDSCINTLATINDNVQEIHSAFMALTNGLAELQNNPPPGPMGMLMKMFVGGMKIDNER